MEPAQPPGTLSRVLHSTRLELRPRRAGRGGQGASTLKYQWTGRGGWSKIPYRVFGGGRHDHTHGVRTHTHATCTAHNTHVNTLALPKPPCQILVKQTTTTTFSAGLIRTRHLLLERGTPGQQSSVPRHAPPWPGRVPAAPAAPRTRARLPAGFAAPLDTSLHASSCFV